MKLNVTMSLILLLLISCSAADDTDAPDLGSMAQPDTGGFEVADQGSIDHSGADGGSPLQPDQAVPTGTALAGISLFQVIDIPVLDAGGQVLDIAERNAPIVADRAVRMVVYIERPLGWDDDIDVQVDVMSSGATETVETAYTLEGDSVVGDPSTAAQLDLPASAMRPGARFVASLSSGGEVSRLPETGEIDLGVQEAGPIKVHLVPYETNGLTPETTPEVVDGFRDAVFAVYPTPEVIITVGDVRSFPSNDLGDLLVDVGVAQESGSTAADVYYYGMVSGVANRDDFQGSTGTSENGGDSPTRAYFAAGAAFGDDLSESTFVHELGHMHQLEHSPCGEPPNVDSEFPNQDGTTGVLGFDFRTGEFVAADSGDLMGYCQPRWIGAYHYRLLLEHVQRSQTW